MKSNIGFVFVVNSEKAFGRFVKESAGEEEMTSCKRRVEDFSSRATSNCRLDVESLVESETSLVKLFDKICRGSEFLIFYLVHQTKYLVFFLPPPLKKNAFLFFFQAATSCVFLATSNSQSVSHFCLHCEAGFH